MKTKTALLLFLLVGGLSTFTQLGIIFHINTFKYLAASAYLITMSYTLYIIINNAKKINWIIAMPTILIIMFYPILSIMLDVFHQGGFKALTDGLIIQGGYYQLLLVGLAIAVLSSKINIHQLIYKYSLITFPIGIFIVFLSFTLPIEKALGIGFLSLTNVFIPSSILAFYPQRKISFLIGWMAIFMILFLSSYLGSRSYTLVGVYLAIGAMVVLHKTRKKLVYKMLFIALIAYLSGAFSFFNATSELREASIIDRYQFDSLFLSLENFLHDGDLIKLFFWEGNSRASILIDAFSSFTMMDWLFGQGINATYISFVERSTIEMAWAQETFRWGLLYVVSLITIFQKSRNNLKKYAIIWGNEFFWILNILILVKLLDGFVYGMPESSVYNLLVFWAVMIQSVKKDTLSKKITLKSGI